MKTLEYTKTTACCGMDINDTGICTECRDQAGEAYYTNEGDELTEFEARAVDTLRYWMDYADKMPKPMNGYRILMHPENTITTTMMQAIVRVCDMYEVTIHLSLSDILSEFSLQVEFGDNMTVFFKAQRQSTETTTDARSALFAD